MPRRASLMSGTSKFVVSVCVLLLAALVVYYGITPPATTTAQQLTDVPIQRPSLFGGDAEEKLIALGFPPIAAEIVEIQPVPIQIPEVVTETWTAIPAAIAPQLTPSVVEEAAVSLQPTIMEVPVVQSAYRFYQVKEGETLGEIAQHELGSYRMWSEIASINGITDPGNIQPGNMLRLPIQNTSTSTVKPTALPVTPATTGGTNVHVIEEGDTFSSIAYDYYGNSNLYGVIVNANPSVDPNRMKIGMRLTIPVR
jgi:nucleoid-associated protein YgaU